MVRALVLARAKPAVRVADNIKAIDGVKDAFEVTGRFDAAALVEVESLSDLKGVALKIQSVEGVRRTESLIEVAT